MSQQLSNEKNLQYYCTLYKHAFEAVCAELQEYRRDQTCAEIRKEFLNAIDAELVNPPKK